MDEAGPSQVDTYPDVPQGSANGNGLQPPNSERLIFTRTLFSPVCLNAEVIPLWPAL